MESGSKMATSSVVFWLLAGILSFSSNHYFMNTATVGGDLTDEEVRTIMFKAHNLTCILFLRPTYSLIIMRIH